MKDGDMKAFFKESITRRMDTIFSDMAQDGITSGEDYLSKLDPLDNDYNANFDDVVAFPAMDLASSFSFMSFGVIPEPYWFTDGPHKDEELAAACVRIFGVTQENLNRIYAISENEEDPDIFKRRDQILNYLESL